MLQSRSNFFLNIHTTSSPSSANGTDNREQDRVAIESKRKLELNKNQISGWMTVDVMKIVSRLCDSFECGRSSV